MLRQTGDMMANCNTLSPAGTCSAPCQPPPRRNMSDHSSTSESTHVSAPELAPCREAGRARVSRPADLRPPRPPRPRPRPQRLPAAARHAQRPTGSSGIIPTRARRRLGTRELAPLLRLNLLGLAFPARMVEGAQRALAHGPLRVALDCALNNTEQRPVVSGTIQMPAMDLLPRQRARERLGRAGARRVRAALAAAARRRGGAASRRARFTKRRRRHENGAWNR
eukprot:2274256-Prymnesium_polylepis.1